MMKRSSKLTMMLAALALLAAAASGCSDDNKSKERMEQALVKQSEMKAYSFAGQAELNVELGNGEQGLNPLTAGLIGLVTKSKLEWSGAAASDPVRLEMDLKSTPLGSNTALELPVILKDNKLFMRIPLLNKQDEYYSVDLAELGGTSGQTGTASYESLKNITKTVPEATKLMMADIPSKWFKQEKAITLKDGTKASVYRLDITDNNRKELSEAVKGKLTQVAELFQSSGLLKQEQAKGWSKPTGSFELQAPGSIVAAVDEAGFIREQSLDLAYQAAGSDGKSRSGKLKLTQTYDDVNGTPAFTKEEPQKVRPLSDILKLLQPSANKKQ